MSTNMSTLDRGFRLVVAAAAVGAAFALGAGTAGGIVLFVVAGILAATSAVGFCPLYALVGFDTRGRTPVVR
jgi:hypothetical protein